jgi:dGTP triphosphohydrolase
MDVSTTTGGGDLLAGQGGIGTGGGFIGGILLGALLGNGNGLFGGRGRDGAAADSVIARNPPEQNQANMDIMAAIGAVDKEVAVNMAAMEASNAAQTAAITANLNNVASSLVTRTEGVKDVVNAQAMVLAQQLNAVDKTQTQNAVTLMQQLNAVDKNILQTQTMIMQSQNAVQQSITADGTVTRALITSQYETNLQRELATAQNEIIELRGDRRLAEATRGIEVNTTNNINQAQAQAQQQQQFQTLGSLLGSLVTELQVIRSTNSAINVGSGTLTASPTNTNTNIR